MRLYHPRTLEIFSHRQNIPKKYSTSVWSEIFKWKASKKEHPKMFIDNDYVLGQYMSIVLINASIKGCGLNPIKVKNLSDDVNKGFRAGISTVADINYFYRVLFNGTYLFSDACSLYYKGINIFPDIFGDEWRKYCPVISHKEIKRQIDKTLNQT